MTNRERRTLRRTPRLMAAVAAATSLLAGSTRATPASADPPPAALPAASANPPDAPPAGSGAGDKPGGGRVAIFLETSGASRFVHVTNLREVTTAACDVNRYGDCRTWRSNTIDHKVGETVEDDVITDEPYGATYVCAAPCTVFVDPGLVQVEAETIDSTHTGDVERLTINEPTHIYLKEGNKVGQIAGLVLMSAAVAGTITGLVVSAVDHGFSPDPGTSVAINWAIVGAGAVLGFAGFVMVLAFGPVDAQTSLASVPDAVARAFSTGLHF